MAALAAKRWMPNGAAAKATGFNWFLSGLGFHELGWRSRPRLRMSARDLAGSAGELEKTDLAFYSLVRLQHAAGQWNSGLPSACRQLFKLVYRSRRHRRPLPFFQSHRPAHVQRQPDLFRQWVVPQHPHRRWSNLNLNTDSLDESVYQLSAGRYCGAEGRGLYGVSHQRRQCLEHSFSEIPLYRAGARTQRTERKVQWRYRLFERGAERLRTLRQVDMGQIFKDRPQ